MRSTFSLHVPTVSHHLVPYRKLLAHSLAAPTIPDAPFSRLQAPRLNLCDLIHDPPQNTSAVLSFHYPPSDPLRTLAGWPSRPIPYQVYITRASSDTPSCNPHEFYPHHIPGVASGCCFPLYRTADGLSTGGFPAFNVLRWVMGSRTNW